VQIGGHRPERKQRGILESGEDWLDAGELNRPIEKSQKGPWAKQSNNLGGSVL